MGTDVRTPALTTEAAGGGLRSLLRRLPLARAWAHFLHTLPLRCRSAEAIFTAIHRRNAWLGEESASGPGSSPSATAALRRELPVLLADLGCDSLLDAPCGDLCWLAEVPLPVAGYCGVDIVEAVIAANRCRYGAPGRTFLCLDFCRDPLPAADLVLCRDGLVHLSFRDALAALANFRTSGASWLLATTFTGHAANQDALTGEWRPLNLELPPFQLPRPRALLVEDCPENEGRYRDKSLGLWNLGDLPALR